MYNASLVAPSSPAPSSPRVSRRAVTSAAAWSAPVILSSLATPAFAASAPTGTLALRGGPFSLVALEERTITGVMQPSNGGSLPTDLQLSAKVTGSVTITKPPVVTSPGVFQLTVKAPSGRTTGALTVSSQNYSGYSPVQAMIESADAGSIISSETGKEYTLIPVAKSWSFSGTSDGVRRYSQPQLLNPSVGTALLDLRLCLWQGSPGESAPNNLGIDPWATGFIGVTGAPSAFVGQRPVSVVNSIRQILSPSRGDLTADPAARAIALRTILGTNPVVDGAGTTSGSVIFTGSSVPSYDASTAVVSQNGFAHAVPKKPTAGMGGNGMTVQAETTVTVYGLEGQQVSVAFMFNYKWSGITN